MIENCKMYFVCLLVGYGFAMSPATAGSCDALVNEDALNKCLNNELGAADKELNRTYAKFREALADKERNSLKIAETAWIKSRDSDCEFEADSVAGGTAYQAVYLECKIVRTRLRTKQLSEWAKLFGGR